MESEQSTAAELVKKLLREQSEVVPSWFVSPHEIDFDPSNRIASGSYGSVHNGKWNGVEVMIKTLHDHDQERLKMFLKETNIWFTMKNPHVVCLFCACHIGKPFFVCEKATNGTLFDFASKVKPASQVWKRFHEAALGLKYIQTMNIVHRDIKGNNILIGADEKSKITDFGLSFSMTSEDCLNCADTGEEDLIQVDEIGAVPWKAPEILNGSSHGSFASDIYFFGMCILEVVSGRIPWGEMPSVAVKHRVLKQKALPKRPAQMGDAQWDLVTQMCAWDPADRLSIDHVVEKLEDIFFQEQHLEWEKTKESQRDAGTEETKDVENAVSKNFSPVVDWNAALTELSLEQLMQLQIEIGKMVRPIGKDLGECDLEQPETEKDEASCTLCIL